MLGGRRLTSPLARRSAPLPAGDGRGDGRRRGADGGRARHPLPDRDRRQTCRRSLVNPSQGARGERGGARSARRPARRARAAHAQRGASAPARRRPRRAVADLPVLAAAPEIRGTQRWFNTPERPPAVARVAARQGRADRLLDLLVHQLHPHAAAPQGVGRALPRRRTDDHRRARAGVPVRARRRQRASARSPATGCATRSPRTTTSRPGRAYGNQYWPAKYLIDARGRVRYAHFGEGDYEETERGDPLAAGRGGPRAPRRPCPRARRGARTPAGATPESYLGAERAERFVNGPLGEGTHELRAPVARRRRPAAAPSRRSRAAGVSTRQRSTAAGQRRAPAPALLRAPRLPRARPPARAGDASASRSTGGGERRCRVTAHRLYEIVRLPRAGRPPADARPRARAPRPMPSPSASPIIDAMARPRPSHGSILVVDDEPTIAEVVARYLERAGYETRVARGRPVGRGRGAEQPARPRRARHHAARLRRPRGDASRCTRTSTGASPVILLTAKGEESDRVVGPAVGRRRLRRQAVLARRARRPGRRGAAPRARRAPRPPRAAALRRARDRPGARARVIVGGSEVELTQREFDLLHFLARHPGQVFSRDQLMDRVWQFSFYTDTTTVTVHIRRLRAKIEPDPRRRGGSRPSGASATASARRPR